MVDTQTLSKYRSTRFPPPLAPLGEASRTPPHTPGPAPEPIGDAGDASERPELDVGLEGPTTTKPSDKPEAANKDAAGKPSKGRTAILSVFLVLLLYASAIAAVWPDPPPVVAVPSQPGMLPVQPSYAALPGSPVQELPAPRLALPAQTTANDEDEVTVPLEGPDAPDLH